MKASSIRRRRWSRSRVALGAAGVLLLGGCANAPYWGGWSERPSRAEMAEALSTPVPVPVAAGPVGAPPGEAAVQAPEQTAQGPLRPPTRPSSVDVIYQGRSTEEQGDAAAGAGRETDASEAEDESGR